MGNPNWDPGSDQTEMEWIEQRAPIAGNANAVPLTRRLSIDAPHPLPSREGCTKYGPLIGTLRNPMLLDRRREVSAADRQIDLLFRNRKPYGRTPVDQF